MIHVSPLIYQLDAIGLYRTKPPNKMCAFVAAYCCFSLGLIRHQVNRNGILILLRI